MSATSPIARPWPPIDRWFWLAIGLGALVVIPRSYWITDAHSSTFDDQYHLERGAAFLTNTLDMPGIPRPDLNDPPLGEGLLALPIVVADLVQGRSTPTPFNMYEHPLGVDRILLLVAMWKSILFLPLVALVFHWCRHLYGIQSAYLACICMLIEPTITAHISVPALDVLGVTGIALACYCAWRALESPTLLRVAAAGGSMALAMLTKHTALILPGVVGLMAGLHWVIRPWLAGLDLRADLRAKLGARFKLVALWVAAFVISFWAFLLFDVHPVIYHPPGPQEGARPVRYPILRQPVPGGLYLWSIQCAISHGKMGHDGYLLGETRKHGWLHYYPVVLSYKVPLGLALVFVLGLVSIRWFRPFWDEWSLLVPALAWTVFLVQARINVGFRHFLPPYVFWLMLESRCVARGGAVVRGLAWCGVLLTAIHGASWLPNPMGYMNYPRHKPYLAINDSNVDWGQGLKQVDQWINNRPKDGRPVYLRYFGLQDREGRFRAVEHYLGSKVHLILPDTKPEDLPTSGILIISPIHEAGLYDVMPRFQALWRFTPDSIIGDSLLVYDLDRMGDGKPFRWN